MQQVKVTLTVDLAELMMQVGESLKGTPQVGEGFRPLITAEMPKKNKRPIFVSRKGGAGPVYTGQSRSPVWTEVMRVLEEAGRALMPQEIERRISLSKPKMIKSLPKFAVGQMLVSKAKRKFPQVRRVADGYELVEAPIMSADESMVLG